MNRKALTRLYGVALAGFIVSAPANATVFSIDSFAVYRDESLFFYDDFNDGIVPPSAGGWTYPSQQVAEYSTIGDPGPEMGGKLALDTSRGFAKSSEVTGDALLVQRNRLRTNTNSDPTSGLKLNHDIVVYGVFDFIAPELNNERYSIRLTDFQTEYAAANDNVDVSVRRDGDGVLSVALRQADFDAGTMNVLDQVLLTDDDFLNYDQIVLGLFTDGESHDVHGGYSLVGEDGATDFMYFDGVGNIFNDEVWTRAAFIASQHVVGGVPEPASIALVMLGLAGFGFGRVKIGSIARA